MPASLKLPKWLWGFEGLQSGRIGQSCGVAAGVSRDGNRWLFLPGGADPVVVGHNPRFFGVWQSPPLSAPTPESRSAVFVPADVPGHGTIRAVGGARIDVRRAQVSMLTIGAPQSGQT